MKKDLLIYVYGKMYEKYKGFIRKKPVFRCRKSLCLDVIVNLRICDNSSLVIYMEKKDEKKKEFAYLY